MQADTHGAPGAHPSSIVLPRLCDYRRLATIDTVRGSVAFRRRTLRQIEEEKDSVKLDHGFFDVVGGHFIAYTTPVAFADPWRAAATVWIDARPYGASRVTARVHGAAYGGIGLRRLVLELDGAPLLATWYVPGRIGQRLLDVLVTGIDPTSWPTEEDDFDFGLHLARVLRPHAATAG